MSSSIPIPSSLGLTIPNSNYVFSCIKAKMFNDHLFLFTKESEIIVYSKQEDKINNVSFLKTKYILMTQMQKREEIIDIFLMDSSNFILASLNKLILAISKSCIIYYFNLIDGLCINKINLSSFQKSNESIVHISEINRRFLIIIFKTKVIVFDSFTKIVVKEEEMKVLIATKESLEIEANELKEDDNNRDKDHGYNSYYSRGIKTKDKNEKSKPKDIYEVFEIDKIYQVKDNSFFIKSKEDNNTYFLQVTNIKNIIGKEINYEEMWIKIIKQRFTITKFFKEESLYSMFSNQDFIVHSINQVLRMSFLDSVEELTEVTDYNTKTKFPIKYINSIMINNEEFLLVLYSDLKCELLTYDTKLRDIKKHKEFIIMVEDEFLNMKFVTSENVLIGYNEYNVNLFDLRRYAKSNEKYADKEIDLKDLFNRHGNNLFFTNYFNSNFANYINDITSQLLSTSLSNNTITSIDEKYQITTSVIFAYSENKSIYYIFGTDTGKVGILDVFFTENLSLNPILIIDYHQTAIETLSIYDNRTLITSSHDGMISFTDISLQKLEAIINKTTIEKKEYIDDQNLNNLLQKNTSKHRRESIDFYSQQFNYSYIRKKSIESKYHKSSFSSNSSQKLGTVTLIPSHNIKNFYRLRRIVPVVKLDLNFMVSNDEEKKKNNSLLALDLENNDVIVIRMDNFGSLYRFNQGTSSISIKAVYHISYQKSLIFYLTNNTIKIASYSTRTCDRYITDLDKIFEILRVDEKLGIYFQSHKKINELVSNISKESLYNDDIQIEKNREKQKRRDQETVKQELYQNLTIQKIKEIITDSNEKDLFTLKLLENANIGKQCLHMTQNKFEAIWMKKIEKWVIDEIIGIINQVEQSDKLKKLQIMNLLYNPLTFLKIQDRYDNTNNGICGNYIRIGEQYNEFLMLNYEDYFSYIEKRVHEQKNVKHVFRTNFFNFLSLFHIWNFVIDMDIFLYQHFKIYQPIFEFFPILIGYDYACSMILNEEEQIDPMINNFHFDTHFSFFHQELNKMSKEREKEKSKFKEGNAIIDNNASIKKDRKDSTNTYNSINSNSERNSMPFRDKPRLLETQQGYLVNIKNYKQSPNLSHHFHLSLFGSLISLLGFFDNSHLCTFIENEKKMLFYLSKKKIIEYSNYEMFNSFMYAGNDDLCLANKDFLLLDFLEMQYTILTNPKLDLGRKQNIKIIMDNIISYLSKVYQYIFGNMCDNNTDGLYQDFYKLNHKENPIESVTNNRLGILSEFELSLITILISYNNIAGYNNKQNKLPEPIMLKITEMLVLFVWKIIQDLSLQLSYSKNVVELLGKSTEFLEIIYKENLSNYAKFLIEFYTIFIIPINFDSLFKTFEISNYPIIKSEINPNFQKIILAKLIKNYSKNKFGLMLKIIVDEFKKKTADYTYFSFLIEILWILFREKNYKHIQYLPTVINLIMNTMEPLNKELRMVCLENSQKVLSRLIVNYPMIAFHSDSQKVAVGANDGKIFIYEMTSGSLWKNLPAHDNEISAICFDATGNIIVSYSSSENLVKCWKIGLTNFFSNFFSMKDGYYKQHKYNEIKEKIAPEEKLKVIKFQLMPNKATEIILIRENKSVEILHL